MTVSVALRGHALTTLERVLDELSLADARAAAMGTVTIVDALNVKDSDTVTITDYAGVTKVFEFDSDTPPGSVGAGHVRVDFTGMVTVGPIAAALAAAITAAGFGVAVVSVVGGVITLRATVVGADGNHTITLFNVNGPGYVTSTGMSGGTDGTYDSILRGYINAASSWLAKKCGRTFQRANAIDELIAGNGRTRIRVARAPIVAVTSVAIDDAVLDSGDYDVDDAELGWLYRRAGWTWSAAITPGLDAEGTAGEEAKNIEVVYNGGFVTRAQAAVGGVEGVTTFVGQTITLPDDLEDACIQLVTSRWLARGTDGRISARSFEASGLTFLGYPVPPAVAAVVAEYALIAHA